MTLAALVFEISCS